jgi:hypothetical protein
MVDKTEYAVWGYWTKSSSDAHLRRKIIGSADTIEEAHQLKDDAEKVGWPTVCIFEGDHIVEPDLWAGRKQPFEK